MARNQLILPTAIYKYETERYQGNEALLLVVADVILYQSPIPILMIRVDYIGVYHRLQHGQQNRFLQLGHFLEPSSVHIDPYQVQQYDSSSEQ